MAPDGVRVIHRPDEGGRFGERGRAWDGFGDGLADLAIVTGRVVRPPTAEKAVPKDSTRSDWPQSR